MTLTAAGRARQTELDAHTDKVCGEAADRDVIASELFGVVDMLAVQPALRRALSDPVQSDAKRADLAASVLKDKIGADTLSIVAATVRERTQGGTDLMATLNRQGVRVVLAEAARQGELEEVSDELFSFSRLVDSNAELWEALTDWTRPAAARSQLAEKLLTGKVKPRAKLLAARSAAEVRLSAPQALAEYLQIAAELGDQKVARITVAKKLTKRQTERLRAQLKQMQGKDVAMQIAIDPAVLGGMRIEIDDHVMDGTIAARLQEAHRRMK